MFLKLTHDYKFKFRGSFVNLYTLVLHQETCRAEIIIVGKAIQCLELDLSLCLKLSLNIENTFLQSLVSGIKGKFQDSFSFIVKSIRIK